jgi:DNA-binding PadR family transcriptional regulator
MIIDTENLSSLSLKELAALLLLYDKRTENSRYVSKVKDTDIKNILTELEKKRYISSVIYATDFNLNIRHSEYFITQKGREELAENCSLKYVPITIDIVIRCNNLANKLRELYPEGKKPGTMYMWKDSTKIISQRLQSLIAKGYEFTDEEAVNATKYYIDGFQGVYDFMQLLKYFIIKKIIKDGEVEETSQLMSYIQNIKENPGNNNINPNWGLTLK